MRPTLLLATALVALSLAAPASAGVRLSFSVSGDTLAALVDGVRTDLDCDPDLAPPAREAWQEVVREGEDGAARFRDEHDHWVAFRRDGEVFRIVTRDHEDRHVRIEIPWEMARCLVGGEKPAPGTARRLRGGELRFDLDVDDDQVELVVASAPR